MVLSYAIFNASDPSGSILRAVLIDLGLVLSMSDSKWSYARRNLIENINYMKWMFNLLDTYIPLAALIISCLIIS
jgi:hypothetical protein